ncbi:MAG: hypothetical protein JXQ27_14410, partial [Acidobacteria bacterium]|nr:hypothetical protein [Acidobacteriota bacterium]
MIAKRLWPLLMGLFWLYAGGSTVGLTDPNPFQIVATEDDAMILELTLPDYHLTDFTMAGTTYQRIQLGRYPRTQMPGHPELPVLGTMLQIPPESSVRVEILEQRDTWLSDCMMFPVQPSLCDGMVMAPDPAIYGNVQPYPDRQAQMDPVVIIRGVPLVRLCLYPFQWYPASGRLRIAESMRIKVFITPARRKGDAPLPHEPAVPVSGSDRLQRLATDLALNQPPPSAGAIRRPIPSPKTDSLVEDTLWEDGEILKITVDHDALYRLTQEELVQAGADPAELEAGNFHLYNLGHPVAIEIHQAGSVFSPGDSIQFWGESYADQFTAENVYWFSWQAETPGPAFAEMDGTLSSGTPAALTFTETTHFQENHIMWTLTPGAPDQDYWYWTYLQTPQSYTFPMELPALDSAAHTVRLRACLQGRSSTPYQPNHHILFYLNELPAPIGEIFWSDQEPAVIDIPVPSTSFYSGDNLLHIALPGDTGHLPDTCYVNWFEVTYERRLAAGTDLLDFSCTATERTRLEISGFSTPDVRIFDITHPYRVAEIIGSESTPAGEEFLVRFEVEPDGHRRFHARAADLSDTPARMEMYYPRHLASPENQAGHLLITSSLLMSATGDLIRFHAENGLHTEVITVEEIYNEFNHGLVHPQAIKDFLVTAYQRWQPPAPAYVLLLGDATLDYRNYRDTGKPSVVPAHLIMTPEIGLTPDDNWYACVDGADEFPDMFIGRLPARDPAAAETMLAKIIDYGRSPDPMPRSLLLVADNNDPAFAALNESLLLHIPSVFAAERVYLENYSQVENATADIIADMNSGQLFTNYIGHGSVTVWAGEYMFDSNDIPRLTNRDQPTVALMMSCINGYFIQPFYYCLAEEFVHWPAGGAVGAFAASSNRYLWEVDILDHVFFEGVFIRGKHRLGEATVHAKLAAYAQGAPLDVVRTYTLFGDPALAIDR